MTADLNTRLDQIEQDMLPKRFIPQLVAALRAVLDLHKRDNIGCCKECTVNDVYCGWPCVTIDSITEALETT